MKKLLLFLALVLTFAAVYADDGRYLFRDGTEYWKIACRTPEDSAEPAIKQAAAELNRALRLVSGAKPAKVKYRKDAEICLGIDSSLKEEEIRVYFDGEKLQISGGSPVATLHAAYCFLQKELGVRWLWPGKDGEFMPQKSAYQVPEKLDIRHLPSIKYRGYHTCGQWYKIHEFREWMARNFINIHRHGLHAAGDSRFIHMWSDHNVRLDKSLFKTHPEYFAEINGRRVPTQICLSNPDVDRLIYEYFAAHLRPRPYLDILSFMLCDNQEYCRCAECRKKSVSTAWFDFYNRLTDRLKAEFPNLKFATLAYQGYIDIPANPVRNTEFVEYTTYNRCNIHKYNDPRCERNHKEYKAMQDWAATGTPMGDYAYEFDIFIGADPTFTPFYGMIKDTVQKTVDLKQIALIPEVGLSPKSGPDHVTHLRDRLALYIYAQLMWDNTKTAEELIGEWCDLAYGPAAGKMKQYFAAMDQQWDSMKIHCGILGRSFGVAGHFMTPDFRQEMADLLLSAEKDLNGAENPALDFEKQLFSMWLKQLDQGERVTLPRENTGKYGSWSPKKGVIALNVGKAPFHVEISVGFGGKVWIFEADEQGRTTQRLRSVVGVEGPWEAEWSHANGVMQIPFASLGVTPKAHDKWQIKFGQNKEQMLFFSPTAEEGKRVVYWTGNHQRDAGQHPRLKRIYNDFGWEIEFVKEGAGISGLPAADIYFFNNPNWGSNKFPPEQWAYLREQISNGATAVFAAFCYFPLGKIMDDPTFELGVGGVGKITLALRRAKTVYPGEWTKKPYEIGGGLWGTITPAYYLGAAKPEYWRVLATLAEHSGENSPIHPFLMVRPYGKGTVICLSIDPRYNVPAAIANILYHRESLIAGLPVPEKKEQKK